MKASKTLTEALAVTAELTGTVLSDAAARLMAADLARYPEARVLEALSRCRRELKGRLTIADVISRIDDGRPGPEEAWAMVPKDESASVVWTAEISHAFGVAYPLMRDGENVQARMAFVEAYREACRKARDEGMPVSWTASLGHDPQGREAVLLEAQRLGRLSRDYVAGLLPNRIEPSAQVKALLPDMSAEPHSVSLKQALLAAKKGKAA
jgi:hypothetical protein